MSAVELALVLLPQTCSLLPLLPLPLPTLAGLGHAGVRLFTLPHKSSAGGKSQQVGTDADTE